MPKNLTDVSFFDAPISVPVSADPRNAASVENPFQQLANRTRFLLNAITVGGALTDRTIFLGTPAARGDWTKTLTMYIQSNANTQLLVVCISDHLPSGAILKEVAAVVKPGAARAGADRMLMKILRWDLTAIAGAGSDPATTQLGSDQFDAGSNARQLITQSGLSETIDRDLNAVVMQLQAGNTGGTGGQEDRFYALRLTYTDVGPRTF